MPRSSRLCPAVRDHWASGSDHRRGHTRLQTHPVIRRWRVTQRVIPLDGHARCGADGCYLESSHRRGQDTRAFPGRRAALWIQDRHHVARAKGYVTHSQNSRVSPKAYNIKVFYWHLDPSTVSFIASGYESEPSLSCFITSYARVLSPINRTRAASPSHLRSLPCLASHLSSWCGVPALCETPDLILRPPEWRQRGLAGRRHTPPTTGRV